MHRVVSDSMRSRSANGLRSAHLSIGCATSARRQEDHQAVSSLWSWNRMSVAVPPLSTATALWMGES